MHFSPVVSQDSYSQHPDSMEYIIYSFNTAQAVLGPPSFVSGVSLNFFLERNRNVSFFFFLLFNSARLFIVLLLYFVVSAVTASSHYLGDLCGGGAAGGL